MAWLLYLIVRMLVGCFQALPLPWAARIGRLGGGLAYRLDRSHRRVALKNLKLCFGEELSEDKIESIAKEHFKRLGENYCSAIKTASMDWTELSKHCEFANCEHMEPRIDQSQGKNGVVAIGHFGNFELFARFIQRLPKFRGAATYRGLGQPALDKLVRQLRERSGCMFFERRTGVKALRREMEQGGVLLGLLADQHAGRGGVPARFFGHLCSTTAAPAVLAMRYHSPLFTAVCYRTGLGQWRIEAGPEIPTHVDGASRSTGEITQDINDWLEQAVRKDPANWFWVHNRWKHRKKLQPTTAV